MIAKFHSLPETCTKESLEKMILCWCNTIPKHSQPSIYLPTHPEFTRIRTNLNSYYFQQTYKQLSIYPIHNDNNITLSFYHLTKHHYLLREILQIVYNKPLLLERPFPLPNYPLIMSILRCRCFNAIVNHFRYSDLAVSIDCLRGNLGHLMAFPMNELRSEIDTYNLRFQHIYNAVEVFLALLAVLFDLNDMLFETFQYDEKDSIWFILKDALECTILFERIQCLFIIENPFNTSLTTTITSSSTL